MRLQARLQTPGSWSGLPMRLPADSMRMPPPLRSGSVKMTRGAPLPRALVLVLSRYRLGLRDVEPDILGRAYEYLIRKFAEGQGQSAGEFYTPREVAILMARILDPEPGEQELSLMWHLVHVHSPTLLRDERRTCLFCRPR
jgi:hypothetical protein